MTTAGRPSLAQSSLVQPSLGELVRTLRQRHGTTQVQLAQQTGLSERTLRRWEAGTHLPRRVEIECLLAHVSATPGERMQLMALVRLADPKRAAPPTEGMDASAAIPLCAILRALRTRAGWRQQQLADALGLNRMTVSQWESGEHLPRPETLSRLIARLCVSAEEGKALWKAGLIGVTGVLSLEDCRNHVERMERGTALTLAPAYELDSLALQHALRGWCRESDEGIHLLARTEIEYAGWLFYHDRLAASQAMVTRALQRVVHRYPPEWYWWQAINLTSTHVFHSAGNGAAAQFLTAWAKRLPSPKLRASALNQAAIHAIEMRQPEEATRLIAEAQRTNPIPAQEGYVHYMNSRIRMLTARDYDGWESVVQQAILPSQQVACLLIGAATANRNGTSLMAQAYLCRIEPLLTSDMPHGLQRQFVQQCKLLDR